MVILAPQQGHQGNSQKVEGNCDVPCCLCHQWKSCAYDIDMHEHQILDIRIGNKTAQKGKNIQQKMGKLYTLRPFCLCFLLSSWPSLIYTYRRSADGTGWSGNSYAAMHLR